MDARTVAELSAELADMHEAGVDVPESLRAAARRARTAECRSIIDQAASATDIGVSLSDALARQPRCFPGALVSLVRAGEAGGDIVPALRDIASHFQSRGRVVTAYRSALIYPTLVLLCAVAVSSFLTFWLFPWLMNVAQSYHLLVQPGSHFSMWGTVIVLQRFGLASIATLAVIAVLLLASSYLGSNSPLFHAIALRMPIYKGLFHSYLVHQFSSVLLLFLRNGVPLREALLAAAQVEDSAVLRRAAEGALRAHERGDTIASGMGGAKWMKRRELWLMHEAEKQGRLESYLQDLSTRSSERVTGYFFTVQNLEPALILVIAVFVALYAIAVFGPVAGITHLVMIGD